MALHPIYSIKASWREHRWNMIWRVTVVLLLSVYGIFGIWYVRYRSETSFAPLENSPPQVVGEFDNPGASRTQVRINDQDVLVYIVHVSEKSPAAQVPVIFTKCNKSDVAVDVQSVVDWAEVDPPNSRFATTLQPGKILPGCQPTPQRVEVPIDVILRAAQIKAVSGSNISLWQIQGLDLPTSSTGKSGKGQTWQTQNFAIEIDK